MGIRSAVLGTIMLACLTFAGCASAPPPTPEQRARIDAERIEREATQARVRAEQQAAMARTRAAFEALVERRIAADPHAPLRVSDPGYAVAFCDAQGLGDDTSSMVLPSFIGISGGGVVCENTAAGRQIIAWREWFCRTPDSAPARIRDCVVSLWGDGTGPSYGFRVTTGVGIALDERGYFTASPPSWQPDTR